MNPCKTCEHWLLPGREDTYSAHQVCIPLDPATMSPKRVAFEVRLCKHPGQKLHGQLDMPNGFALCDPSDRIIRLATGEQFGCVLHASK